MNQLLTAKPPQPLALENSAQITRQIQAEHQRCLASPAASLVYAGKAGLWLMQLRSQLSPRQWQTWLRTDCPVSAVTAENYIKIASQWSYFSENLRLSTEELSQASTVIDSIRAVDPSTEAVIDVDFVPTPIPIKPEKKANVLRFCLSGGVVPKARPRVTRNGTYLPQRYRTWRNHAEIELYRQMCDVYAHQQFPLEKAAISLRFFGNHRTNSDIDNLAGACLDALTLNGAGILKDDNLRCLPQLTVEYVPDTPETGVWIEIEPLS